MFYAHYDIKTGEIHTLSNEKLDIHEHSLEISESEYVLFATKAKNITEYYVNTDNVDQIVLAPKAAKNQGIKFAPMKWVKDTVKDSTSFIVKHNSGNQCWDYKLTEHGKNALSLNTPVKFIFFIVNRDNPDMLIRTMELDFVHLYENGECAIPFETSLESEIGQLMIATRSRFKDYGLQIE